MNKWQKDDRETDATEDEEDSARDPANLGDRKGCGERSDDVSGEQEENGHPGSYSKCAGCLRSLVLIWGHRREVPWFICYPVCLVLRSELGVNLNIGIWVVRKDFLAAIFFFSLQRRVKKVILEDDIRMRRWEDSDARGGFGIHRGRV